MEIQDEKKLVQRARKDPEVFGELYYDNYSKIFGYILKRVANVEIALDVTSETFFKALKNVWQFRWRNVRFSAWLYQIANHEVSNYFRKNKYHAISLEALIEEKGFEVAAADNPETEFFVAEERLKEHADFLVIQEKLSVLPEKYQEVIVLKFFEKKKTKEIAEILGKKEGTVKSLVFRGLEKLREAVGIAPLEKIEIEEDAATF